MSDALIVCLLAACGLFLLGLAVVALFSVEDDLQYEHLDWMLERSHRELVEASEHLREHPDDPEAMVRWLCAMRRSEQDVKFAERFLQGRRG